VIAGAGDSITAAVANGLVPGGPILAVIGSAGNVSAAVDALAIDLQGRVHTGCYATDASWIVTGVQQAAGFSLQWLRTCLRSASGAEEEYEELVGSAASAPAGSEGLIFLPHLMGERSPIYMPHARGAFLGLSMNHSAAHLVRAVMEGVAYAQRGSIDVFRELGLPVERLLAAGGGARSRLWRSIQASVNRLPVAYRRPGDRAVDSSALGAAMLAGVHVGFYPSAGDAARLIGGGQEEALDVPDDDDAAVYEEGFRIYHEVSRSISHLSQMLTTLVRTGPARSGARG
jgi:xylulokinase